ncbi:helix-turn-helix domain-containing protein [Streptomyces boluensis]|uniref:Helix-turn-helix domain-containing protein n=1 Tax=Streptomyces boluensis TaxID=1775135 RepID=A0A964XMQ8_9ACTN|nr:helix-turn-helix transcriptional regulator [Streptomyces boluensis]NBE54655.1 helix-turn-helix domain-containing protein [Streptomyces boluensis]
MGTRYGDWVRPGMTQQELAVEAVMTRSHIAHIEAGRRVPSREDARRLDRALGTGDVLQSFLPGGDDDPVAEHFEAARHLEKQATAIREFGLNYVPGILQTAAYAHAVLRETAYPPLSPKEREKAVATRLKRAAILNDPVNPVMWAMLDEAVMRRPIGGPGVMTEQLTHLADLAENGRIRTHVLPLGTGGHPLLSTMLSLMWFEDQPPAAYMEGLYTGGVEDSPALVELLQGAYHQALGDALPVKESVALLRATAKDYADHES